MTTSETEAVSSVAAPPAATGFAPYLVTHAAWFLAFGIQGVLFPYLLRVVLEADEIHFGLAQMASSLPTTLLILIGGLTADRIDTRKAVIGFCAFTILIFAVLGTLVATGALSYPLMIGYALTVGTMGAFMGPARDSLLSRVAPQEGGIQRAVALANMAQFGAQLVGMGIATLTPVLGVPLILFGQAGVMAIAAASGLRIRPRPAEPRATGPDDDAAHLLIRLGRDLVAGFRAAAGSPVIGPVLLLATGMGVFFTGAFVVLLPLTVQTYFAGAADKTAFASGLGAFSLCFWGGTMLSAVVLVRVGAALRKKGLAFLLALTSGSLLLFACAIPMPLWSLCAVNFLWGLGGGVAMTLSRGLVQEYAPADKRARVLSIFSLGMMGGAPVGAVFYGVLAHAIGPRLSILVPAAGMLAVTAAVAAFSRLRHLED
ncbi:MAG: MFS transporter [Caulobacteraceae bacterium]